MFIKIPSADDDYAAYKLGVALGKPVNVTSFLLERAMRAPFTLFNDDTGFMEARNADGSWAGGDRGWTEGRFTFHCHRFFLQILIHPLSHYQAISGHTLSTSYTIYPR